jgi:hypothetical protein
LNCRRQERGQQQSHCRRFPLLHPVLRYRAESSPSESSSGGKIGKLNPNRPFNSI